MRRSACALLVGSVALAGVLAACGSERPPPESERGIAIEDAGSFPAFAPVDARPGCEMLDDGGPCGCAELALLNDVPNLYFVIDRSGSMGEALKLGSVRLVTSRVATRLGPRANFGAALYPSPRSDDGCAPGVEVMAPRPGDSPAGKAGATVFTLIGATNVPAQGGTPTGATLRELTPRLAALPGRTYLVLATDGAPNCNPAGTCAVNECIPNLEEAPGCPLGGPPNCCEPNGPYGRGNCLDGRATLDALTNLRLAGIPTYVIGIPGSAAYAGLLDAMAQAGGTARVGEPAGSRYFRVDTAGEGDLERAFAEVAAKVTATCELDLSAEPADPGRVNVYLDDVVLPKEPDNGWTLEGTHVTLRGTTCARVLRGEVLNLRVIAGCPTATPR